VTLVQHTHSAADRASAVCELVVCSLESWDEVWRRNQFFVDALLRRTADLRVLFVEPPADVLFDLANRRKPPPAGVRALRADGRLHAVRPIKPLPRLFGPLSDVVLRRWVIEAARRLKFVRPTLWINDVTYAPLIRATGWPTLYDVTDDWLLAPLPQRQLRRLRRLEEIALAEAAEVVVCSAALAESRGTRRDVTLVPNGVDIEHFQRPHPRPVDLPESPTAVYVGTLHTSRLDLDLVIELARSMPALSVVLVGPNSLDDAARRRLLVQPNICVLGARPYHAVPAYLQHASVVIVPHLVTPFTDSLDPIKAYESAAVARPTIATPVAGFRELAQSVVLADREAFPGAVVRALSNPPAAAAATALVDWNSRALAFEASLLRAGCRLRGAGYRE
jgi:glycosyltransferase involved in cell wall biosynthesis